MEFNWTTTEPAMSFRNNLAQYFEMALMAVLALAALAGIVRFVILAKIF